MRLRKRTQGEKKKDELRVPGTNAEFVSALRTLVRRLQVGSAHDTIRHLVLEHQTVPKDLACRELSPGIVDSLVTHGFILLREGMLFPLFQVQVFQGLTVISDLIDHADRRDFVLPVGPASQHLARLAIRAPGQTVLDMGCGSGIQALLASRHARHVLATDINPRALAFTRLNAIINGISNIDTAEGSYFEPVRGRKFDLILFNPPYIISPGVGADKRYAFCDKDAYIHSLLRMLPEHLTAGAYAQMTLDWTHAKDEPWQHPLKKTLTELKMDALILYQGSLTAGKYAFFWTKHTIGKKQNGFQQYWNALNWAAWLSRQRIENIAFGSLTLRCRSSSKNWIRAEAARSTFGDSVGNQLMNIFINQDLQAGFQETKEILHAPLELERSLFHKGGGEKAGELCATAGVLFPIQIRNITWQVIDALDGRTNTSDVVQRVLQSNGLESEKFLHGILEDLNSLFRFGWLRIGSVNIK